MRCTAFHRSDSGTRTRESDTKVLIMAGQNPNGPQPLNPPPLLQIQPRPFPPPVLAQNPIMPQPLLVPPQPQQPQGQPLFRPPVPAPPPPSNAEGSIGVMLDPNWFKVIVMRCTAGVHQGTASVTLNRWQGTWNFLPNEFVESAIFASSGLPIKHMILKHHCLSRLPANFAALETGLCFSLTTLDLSHNKFTSLPSMVCQLVELKELFLNHNEISQLPEQVSNLTKLENLHLQVNCLQVLPVCVCSLSSLKYLNAEDNMIEVIPSEVCQLRELREMFLKSNKIEHLPPTFSDLPKLEELHLSNNRLKEIHLKGLTSLRQLHVANNCLRFLPPALVELNLQGLTVSHNPLKFPPLSVCREGLERVKAYMLEKYHDYQCVWANPYYNSDGDDTDYEDMPQ